MTNTEKSPFTPFAPPPAPMFEGPLGPLQEAASPPAKRKRSSAKKAAPKAAPTPAAPLLRAKRKKVAGEPKAVKAPRKARGAPKGKRAPKFELGQILRIASGMKEADQKLFEAVLGEMSAVPKAQRRRVLAAIGQVFG